MIRYLLQGLLLGLAYVAPIGTQNLFVINTALRKKKSKALQVALVTTFFDISLAVACFFGIGLLVGRSEILKGSILLMGSIIVIYIGMGLLSSSSEVPAETDIDKSFYKIVFSCFAVTWFNPQAIIDGSLLLGGIRVSLQAEAPVYFIIGVCAASFAWFTSLALIITQLQYRFVKIIKYINNICGTIIIFYGVRLGYSFLKLIL